MHCIRMSLFFLFAGPVGRRGYYDVIAPRLLSPSFARRLGAIHSL